MLAASGTGQPVPWTSYRTPHDFCGLPAWNACPEPSHEEMPGEPKWKDILQNNWPVLFKTRPRSWKTKKDRGTIPGSWILKRHGGLPWCLRGKESACQCRRHRFDPRSRKIPQATESLSLCTTTVEPMLQSPRITTAEPTHCSYWSPCTLELMLHNKKPVYCNED